MTASHEMATISNKMSAKQRLEEFLETRRAARSPVADIEQFEKEMHRIFAAAEAEVMGEELARFDIDVPIIVIEDIEHRQVLRCEEEYFTSSGPVRLKRSLYSTRQPGDHAVCPLELRAGLIDNRWTPLAAQQAVFAVAHLTPQEAENMFKKLGNMTPSKSSLDRLPKALNEVWESNREEFERKLRFEEAVKPETKAVAISLDGVLIPMKDGNRAFKRAASRKNGKKSNGPAGYQEASCGTLSFYDLDGDLLSTIRMARMPEENKVTLKEMLTQELEHILSQRPDLTVVKLADGAKDNWRYLCKKEMPEGIEILDFYHAAEHLNAALEAAYGEGNNKARAQFEKLRHILRHEKNGIDKVIRAFVHLRKQHPRNKKIVREIKYFRNNRHRMRYAERAANNLPIGSGIVEAACKTLTSRLKRSGMRWRNEGGQAILSFRSLIQSCRFDSGWRLLAETYKREVQVPKNIVALNARNRRS
jgi:hypothetical protein